MKTLHLLFLSFSLPAGSFIMAQNPYAGIGKTASPMLSLSNGKYAEHFENDSIRQIGSVMVNVYTEKIVAYVDRKGELKKTHARTSSRFLSIDPLARQFPFYSPYQYAGNKAISSIDADGLEDVDYRVVESYDDGSAYVKVARSEGSTADSHNGNLQIHNLNDGKTYGNFEWNELNSLFGISGSNSFVGDKINPAGVAGPGSYSFRLYDPNDIIRGGTNADGTKNVISFSALVSKARTVTPYNSITGGVSSVADTPQNTRKYLLETTKEMIDPNQAAFGQSASDVTEINISVGTEEYKNVNTSDFINNLQSTYKNAKINIVENTAGTTGYTVEYKGKEAKQAPVPVTE